MYHLYLVVLWTGGRGKGEWESVETIVSKYENYSFLMFTGVIEETNAMKWVNDQRIQTIV